MTASKIDRVLGALVEQEAVRYAVVTGRDGDDIAQAGDLPRRDGSGSAEAAVGGGSGAVETPVRTMVEVGEGRILHVGTTRELAGRDLRQLRSVVASAM